MTPKQYEEANALRQQITAAENDLNRWEKLEKPTDRFYMPGGITDEAWTQFRHGCRENLQKQIDDLNKRFANI